MDSGAVTGALLYVSTAGTDVAVYSYPKEKLVGTITGFSNPSGECVDARGNVFVVNTNASDILEYAHGGTVPIGLRNDSGYFPMGCSVDPVSGDLAVTNLSTIDYMKGDLVIFDPAGKVVGTYAEEELRGMNLCGYDASGNLFADAYNLGYGFAFVELPHGSTKLTNITLERSIGEGSTVQWDGRHIAVGDGSTNTIYRFKIAGDRGKLVGSTQLSGGTIYQFFIDGKRVIGSDFRVGNVNSWAYPTGGSPLKTLGGLSEPGGTVVSQP